MGNAGATGTLPTTSAITDNGTLTINRTNAVAQGTDFSGAAITGTGGLTQAGSGTTTLNAANTFSGTTRATAGAIVLTNSLRLQNSTLDMNAADSGTVTFDNSISSITLGALTGNHAFSANSAASLTVGTNNKNAGPHTRLRSAAPAA